MGVDYCGLSLACGVLVDVSGVACGLFCDGTSAVSF